METETTEAADDETKNDEAEGEEDKPEIEPILDYKEGDEIGPEIENKIPKYNCKRQVGHSLVSQLTCFECHICNKYFDTEKTAEIHSRTFNHHRMFVKFLNEKANEIKIAQKRAAAALAEETERQKRIKLDNEAKPEESGEKSELYDPSEATGDDDTKDGEEITDEVMKEVVDTTVEEKPTEEVKPEVKVEEKIEEAPKVEEPAKIEEKPAEVVTPVAQFTPVTPVVAPVTPVVQPVAPVTPVVQSQPQQQQNQQQNQQNTPNKQFGGNRGGNRGGRGNRRSGRYGGNRF